jgi:hypothetical protein
MGSKMTWGPILLLKMTSGPILLSIWMVVSNLALSYEERKV